jgi:acetylornithine/succinyldiaminopimelate/putrescine aminotransferase
LVEPVQAEAGVIMPKDDFLMTLRQRCSETGTLLIFDEIQTGFGRTGKLFCFMDYNVTPDILCIAKAMGGGMPIGAFIADKRIMLTLTHNPDFGHITTFGGHPVSAAAAIATLEELTKNPNLINQVDEKGAIYESALKNHSLVKGIRRKGLLISVELPTVEINQKIIQELLQNGLVTDPFFFMPQAFRIAPPLIITKDEIALTLELINKTFKNL